MDANTPLKNRKKLIKQVRKQAAFREMVTQLPLNKINYRKLDGYYDFDEFKSDFFFYRYASQEGAFGKGIYGATEDIFSLQYGIEEIVRAECKFLWLDQGLINAFENTQLPAIAEINDIAPLMVLFVPREYTSESKSTGTGTTHASPRTHWRMGHWRRVAIGEGRSDRASDAEHYRRWQWIKPVLVNPGN